MSIEPGIAASTVKMKVAAAKVSIVRIARLGCRITWRMTRRSVCIASRLAQGLDDRKIRRAPGWQQATGNSNQQGRDDSAQQRAQGEGRRKDHSADAHEPVIETSREAQ